MTVSEPTEAWLMHPQGVSVRSVPPEGLTLGSRLQETANWDYGLGAKPQWLGNARDLCGPV